MLNLNIYILQAYNYIAIYGNKQVEMKNKMILTQQLLERFFVIFNYTNEIDIDYDNLIEIQPDAFMNCRNRKIKTLRLQSKYPIKINSDHSSLFEPLKEHLEELNLKCSLECEFNFLKHLENLKKLTLNVIWGGIGKPVFNAANNQLTHLDLSNFENHSSHLKISDKTMFNDLTYLTHLDLSKVTVDDNVLPELFSELKQLDTLKLIRTKLTPTQDAFIYLKNLRELHFVDIQIPKECSNIFAPLKSLQ